MSGDSDEKAPLIRLGEVPKEVYKDAVAPGAKQLGKTLETVTLAVNVALAPLRLRLIAANEFHKEIEKAVVEKLANVKPEDISTPQGNVFKPALDGAAMVWDDPDLREMFANLIASSFQPTKGTHPGFANALSQFSPDDARLFRLIASGSAWLSTQRGTVVAEGGLLKGEWIELSVNHLWERLGLITSSRGFSHLSLPVLLRSYYENGEEFNFGWDEVGLTVFGRAFAFACLPSS